MKMHRRSRVDPAREAAERAVDERGDLRVQLDRV
jgi:hypothetical protein